MAKELFEAVIAAEQKADQITQEAQRKARELIKGAELFCAQTERDMAREHRVLYQSIIEEKRAETQLKLAEDAKEKRDGLEVEITEAKTRVSVAAKRIAERVLSDGNR